MELPRIAANSGSLRTRYIIEAKNLSYKLRGQIDELNWLLWKKTADDNAYILRKVNCEARPGEIMAIAGPSGAGKSTLLEILAGVIPPSRVSGEVLVNGQPMNARCFRRLSGYVAQDEAFFPLLTVKETLMYSARLRLPGSFHTAAAIVQELLKQLGLEHVANVRIGSESNRGISGGEKRRVSVGVDLVHDPGVLLIDEPTSGLDSASALHIILLLKSMAIKQGKTIVLTIHQPGFRILELFDKILLISNGTVHHHGSLHLLKQRLRFAGDFIPRHVNVLEFAIEMTESLAMEDSEARKTENSDVARDEELTRRNPNRYSNINVLEFAIEMTESLAVEDSEARETENSDVAHDEELTGRNPNRYSNIEETIYANGRFKEVLILGQRFSHIICRTNQLFAARILQAVLGAVVLGTLFMNVMNDSKRHKLQTQIGFFAYSLAFLLSSTTEGLPIFLQERRILKRETSKGAYRVSSYVVSNTLVFLPFLLVVALLYSTPVYWLVGLRRTTDGFLYFLLVAWMVVLMSNSFVACFSALVPNFIMGTSLIAGLVGSFFLFSGYFIPKDDMPKYWIFMHYLSLFKYPFECFMINEYGGEEGKRKCLKNIEGSCYLYGEEFLKQQGVEESNKWSNLAVMTGFILGYRLLCFLILLCRSYRTRI